MRSERSEAPPPPSPRQFGGCRFRTAPRPQRRVSRTASARAVHSAAQQGCSAHGDGPAAAIAATQLRRLLWSTAAVVRGPAGLWPARWLEIALRGRSRWQWISIRASDGVGPVGVLSGRWLGACAVRRAACADAVVAATATVAGSRHSRERRHRRRVRTCHVLFFCCRLSHVALRHRVSVDVARVQMLSSRSQHTYHVVRQQGVTCVNIQM